jgi:hypothetical protein
MSIHSVPRSMYSLPNGKGFSWSYCLGELLVYCPMSSWDWSTWKWTDYCTLLVQWALEIVSRSEQSQIIICPDWSFSGNTSPLTPVGFQSLAFYHLVSSHWVRGFWFRLGPACYCLLATDLLPAQNCSQPSCLFSTIISLQQKFVFPPSQAYDYTYNILGSYQRPKRPLLMLSDGPA